MKIKKKISASVISYKERVTLDLAEELNDYLVFGSCYAYPGVEFIIHESEVAEFSKEAWDKKVAG